jgi:polyisoprenoid-binding protein YceI
MRLPRIIFYKTNKYITHNSTKTKKSNEMKKVSPRGKLRLSRIKTQPTLHFLKLATESSGVEDMGVEDQGTIRRSELDDYLEK